MPTGRQSRGRAGSAGRYQLALHAKAEAEEADMHAGLWQHIPAGALDSVPCDRPLRVAVYRATIPAETRSAVV
jgi:hypothetical protein